MEQQRYAYSKWWKYQFKTSKTTRNFVLNLLGILSVCFFCKSNWNFFHKYYNKVNFVLTKNKRSRNFKSDMKQNFETSVQHSVFKMNLFCNSANGGLTIISQDIMNSPCSWSNSNFKATSSSKQNFLYTQAMILMQETKDFSSV